MAFYDYQCPTCGIVKDVMHPMSEIDKGYSQETLSQITCDGTECNTENKNIGCIFKRCITSPMIKTKSLSKEEIKSERKKRNQTHFQKETLPYLPKAELMHHALKGVKPL